MKKFYLFLSIFFFTISVGVGQTTTTIASVGTTTTSATPSGWTFSNLGVSTTYLQMTGTLPTIITPSLDLSVSSCTVTLSLDIATFGTITGSDQVITVKISTNGGSSYTTYTTVTGSSSSFTTYTFDITAAAASSSNVKAEFLALNSDGTHGARLENIYIKTICPSSVCTPPTANTNTLAAQSVATTSLTLHWGTSTFPTNGSNEIVVISTNSTAPSPVGGTVYSVGGTMGVGYNVVYNGISANAAGTDLTQSVTGLTCGTTYYMYVIEYNNTGTSSPCYKTTSILKGSVSTSACPCIPPTTAATGVNIVGVSTGSVAVNWSSGDGTNELVVISTNNTAPTPAGGTAYTGNTFYGSGSTVGSGYYTVYSGVAASSVNITGLSCGVTYYVYVFEYNTGGSSSPCYYSTSGTDNQATSSCGGAGTVLPQLTGIVTDACDNGVCNCGEGSAEVTFMNSGTYTIDPTKLGTKTIQYFGSTSSSGYPTTGDAYSGSFSSNASMTSTLNSSTTTCTGVFINAITGTIPPNSPILLVPYNFCPSAYDFSSLCASSSPIYVLYFGTNNTGVSDGKWEDNYGSGCSSPNSGNYGNNGSGTAYIKITIPAAALSPASSAITEWYTYNKATEMSGNGATEGWSGTPGTTTGSAGGATTYTNSGSGSSCRLPIVLPVNFLSFTANRTNLDDIIIKWATATETNNDYFDLEYSLDGEHFTVYKKVKGIGNSTSTTDYSCYFTENVGNENLYFRLKQVDLNGKYQYSTIITLSNSVTNHSNLVAYYNTEKDKITTKFNLEFPQEVSIGLYDITGTKLYESIQLYNEGNNDFLLTAPDKIGVYILVYQNGNSAPIRKKIIVLK